MRKTYPGEGYGRPDRLSDEKKRALLKINYDRQQREGARRIRYTELHKDKYSALKEAGEKNAHRRAARQARTELAAQAAPEVPEV
ncbi:MAG: hypothetical protein J6O55_02325 [Lachnospiraceae bacterium]|nr:hypothetical protein [Lachnospiraceae bacterium]